MNWAIFKFTNIIINVLNFVIVTATHSPNTAANIFPSQLQWLWWWFLQVIIILCTCVYVYQGWNQVRSTGSCFVWVSSWSDLVYKISRSDLDSNLDHMRSIMLSDPKELCILDGDNGSVSPDCPQAIWRNWLYNYFDCPVLAWIM